MVDAGRVRSLLGRLRERRDRLRTYERLSLEEFMAGDEGRLASKYLLLTAIEDVISVANHVIASEGFRSPGDYAEAFSILIEHDIIDRELGVRLQRMARFRNLLVHVYADVDDERVHAYLTSRLDDLDRFAAGILKAFPEAG